MEVDPRRRRAQLHLAAFGRCVRRARQDAGITQEELAHRAGLHRTVVGRIERAEREVGISTLWALAEALTIHPRNLIPD